MTRVDEAGVPVAMGDPWDWSVRRNRPERMNTRAFGPSPYQMRVSVPISFVTTAPGYPYSYWVDDGPDSLADFDDKLVRFVSSHARPDGGWTASITLTMAQLLIPAGGSLGYYGSSLSLSIAPTVETASGPNYSRMGLGSWNFRSPYYLDPVITTAAGVAPFVWTYSSELLVTDVTHLAAMATAPWTIQKQVADTTPTGVGLTGSFALNTVRAAYPVTLAPRAREGMGPGSRSDRAYFT